MDYCNRGKEFRDTYEPQSNIDRLAQRPVLPQCPREWEWACRNGECIAHYDVCDGITQCTDGSDEWNCDGGRGGAPMAREGVAAQRESHVETVTVAAVAKEATTVASSGTVTIQYSHILFAIFAFFILSIAVVTVIRKRSRQKTGFRNRRGGGGGGHSILQQDSDEDDILISSMYS
uniref:Low-density lipoprotein receptor domain class A n=1 Tax=Caenorhabditis tropicalis TaxID=1561998 RepID=A0A1I7T536_9PELO